MNRESGIFRDDWLKKRLPDRPVGCDLCKCVCVCRRECVSVCELVMNEW